MIGSTAPAVVPPGTRKVMNPASIAGALRTTAEVRRPSVLVPMTVVDASNLTSLLVWKTAEPGRASCSSCRQDEHDALPGSAVFHTSNEVRFDASTTVMGTSTEGRLTSADRKSVV